MKRALPLINEARNPPTVGPLFVSGRTLAPRLGPSGTRIGGEGQGEYGGKDSTRRPSATALMDLAEPGRLAGDGDDRHQVAGRGDVAEREHVRSAGRTPPGVDEHASNRIQFSAGQVPRQIVGRRVLTPPERCTSDEKAPHRFESKRSLSVAN